MKVKITNRGFPYIEHPAYVGKKPQVVVAQSSAIGDYEHSMDLPGFLSSLGGT